MKKRRKIEASSERIILTGCVVNSKVLSRVVKMYTPDLATSRVMGTVMGWCTDYFEKHGEAPGRHIEDIFKAAKRRMEPDTASMVSDLLQSLSSEYERNGELNVGYVSSQAQAHFQEVRLRAMAEDMLVHLDNGDVSLATEALNTTPDPSPQDEGVWVDPFGESGLDVLFESMQEAHEPLFTLPGKLGEMMNEHMIRDGFVVLQGPEKIGKSWMLMKCSERAARKRRNVAVFEVGDMSLPQIQRRFAISITGKSDLPRYCGQQLLPFVTKEDKVEYKPIDVGPPMEFSDFRKARKRNRWLGRIRLKAWAAGTASPQTLEAQLRQWQKEDGWVPDVIIIDYVDLLGSESKSSDFRHDIISVWRDLRAMSQRWSSLVITATQANKAAHGRIQTRLNTAEDKRKVGYPTAIFSLNKLQEESDIIQVGAIAFREAAMPGYIVDVVQCLKMGKPIVGSFVHVFEESDEEND